MKVIIASDHAAVDFKKDIIDHLEKKGITVLNAGTDDPKSSCDYPDFAVKVCEAVLAGKADFGILICGTGIGMSIAANKFKGIRCALCGDTFSAKATREHNDANILALGARVISKDLSLEIADIFLSAKFSGDERHIKRIEKIAELEK